MPDEHWQSLEVAHAAVYGAGALTWEWRLGLRSVLHPLPVMALYTAATALGLDPPPRWMLTVAPRVLQAGLWAGGEVALWLVARRLGGPCAAWAALACSIMSWFTAFCAPRTLSNSTEAALVAPVLWLWPESHGGFGPDDRGPARLTAAAVLSAVLFLIRPTSLLLWVVPGLAALACSRTRMFTVWAFASTWAIVLALGAVADSVYYQRPTLSWLNFVRWNVWQSVSTLYGTHPWYWALSPAGLPALAPLSLGLAAYGALRFTNPQRRLGLVALVYVAAHSCMAHKEHRFMLPVLPILHLLAGVTLARMQARPSRIMLLLLLLNLPVMK